LEPADDLWQKYRIARWEMPKVSTKPDAEAKVKTKTKTKTKAPSQSFVLEAEDFTRKVDQPGAAWEIIPGLGRTGKGSVSGFPVTAPQLEAERWASQASRLEYDIHFPTTSEFSLRIYLIPTLPLNGETLRFAVALDDAVPQLVALDVKDGSS